MRRVSTMDLVPGMVTAEDVYTFSNQLIIPKGEVLTDKTITKLEFYSVINVRIDDSVPAAATAPVIEISPNDSYSEKVKKSPQFLEFRETFELELPKFQNLMDSIANDGATLNVDDVMRSVDNLLANSHGYLNVFDMLHNLREYDDQTYVHGLNVALICNVFARWLRMTDEEIRTATICGLLHDIGKILVPENVLKKPSKLTDNEYSIIKRHTLEGYNLLRKQGVPECIMNSALMHHERCDGSGYPFGIRNSKIDPFAKIVAIADVYDAMTSARCYRGPLCPFKVIEIFESEGLQKYDTRFIMTFLENIVNTYVQQRVRLSDGRVGEVIFINRNALAKPTVNCDGIFVDLAAEDDLHVDAII